MKEGRTIDPDKIHLVQLQTIKGAISNEADSSKLDVREYGYKCDASIAINAQDKIIGIKLEVIMDALGPNKEKTGLTANYTHELIFVVDNLDDFSDPSGEGEEPKVERLMLGTLMGIAYSTVRGIIYTRTQGTPFYRAVLPVVDPKTFIKPAETSQPEAKNNV